MRCLPICRSYFSPRTRQADPRLPLVASTCPAAWSGHARGCAVESTALDSYLPRAGPAQVYDGQTDGAAAPYTEASPASPLNAYGRTKLLFERALAERRHAVVLRSSLILGPPTPEKCRKQSFLQVCPDAIALWSH